MTKKQVINKIAKGMSTYFTEVEKIKLGESEIDFLLLNTPPICNYRCKKCFTWAKSRKIENPLKLSEILKLIKEAKELGAKNISILGEGEPLLHKDIKKIVAYIDKLGIVPMLATNASLLNKSMVDFLYKHNATIGFSLDTLDPKEYRDFCGDESDLNKVLDNINYARKVFKDDIYQKGNYKVYRLVIHMTVTPQNFKNMSKIQEFCGEDILFDSQPLAIVGDAKKNTKFFGKANTYEEYQKNSTTRYRPMVLSETEKGKNICCLFYYGLAINYNGEIMFDTHAIDMVGYIGNIRDYPLKDLLARLKKIRKLFVDNYEFNYCPVRDKSYKEFVKFIKDSDIISK